MDFGELLAGPVGAGLGFGGVAGLVVGYTVKKVTKLVALALGLIFVLIQGLVYSGYISVDWGAVQSSAEQAFVAPDGRTMIDQVWEVISANLPFGGGFAAGFAIGLKVG